MRLKCWPQITLQRRHPENISCETYGGSSPIAGRANLRHFPSPQYVSAERPNRCDLWFLRLAAPRPLQPILMFVNEPPSLTFRTPTGNRRNPDAIFTQRQAIVSRANTAHKNEVRLGGSRPGFKKFMLFTTHCTLT